MTSRIIPNSSKYPPRPWVPNGSLNVMVTLAIVSRFQSGWNIVLANLQQQEQQQKDEP